MVLIKSQSMFPSCWVTQEMRGRVSPREGRVSPSAFIHLLPTSLDQLTAFHCSTQHRNKEFAQCLMQGTMGVWLIYILGVAKVGMSDTGWKSRESSHLLLPDLSPPILLILDHDTSRAVCCVALIPLVLFVVLLLGSLRGFPCMESP